MRFKQILTVVLLVVIASLTGCNRNPEVAKRKYLESGNRYYARGKYKEARIMYLDALQKDQKFGTAHYKFALTALKLGPMRDAVAGFRRAIDTLPDQDPDKWDAVVKLSELYLVVAKEQKQFLDEVDENVKKLLKRDPQSFDGHRLMGDLLMARSAQAVNTARKEEAQSLMKQALAEYEIANQLKPDHDGVMMQLARANATLGDFNKAEALYKRVIDTNKGQQSAYTELYKLYVIERKLGDGEQALKTAFQANPKSFGFLTTLAMHYSLTGRHDDMVSVLQQIKGRAKDFDQAYLVVGDFYLRIGDGESAIREYKEGFAKDPKQKATYQKRMVEVYMRQGRRAEAADLNTQILKQDPKDNDAKGLAATFLLDKGDVARAITELQSVVTRSPENPVAHYHLGRAHAARGEYEQARQQFQKAIDLRGDYIVARLGMAQLQITRGDYDAALKSAQQVLQIDRNSMNARLIQSAALMGLRKFGDTRDMLGGMMKINPNSPDVYFQMGMVSLAENKYKEAEEAFRRTHQLSPANPRGLMGIVETQMAQSKSDEALKLLRAESEKNPNSVELRLAIGNIAVRAGKYDEAVQSFNQILGSLDNASKSRGDIYLRIGETYRRKGDDGGAVAVLQKARELLPDNVTVLATLALTLDHAGRWSEAKQVYEATLKLDANSGIPLNNLAFLIAEHNGDLDEALTKATKAKQLLPNTHEVSDTLGWIYLKKNLSDNAIEIFKELVQKAPHQSTFRFHLGMALYQKGDRPRAAKELQEALKYNPAKDEKEKIQALLQKLTGA